MTETIACPVCLSADGYGCTVEPFGSRDARLFDCDVCGAFAVSRTALDDYLELRMPGMTRIKRAAISHKIRVNNDRLPEPWMLTTYELESLISDGLPLPTPNQQALNAMRYIGDRVTDEGVPVGELPPEFSALIGSPSREFACNLVVELRNSGLITGLFLTNVNGPAHVQELSLTLAGWGQYEEERRGRKSGSYGFIALKFGDETLDPLVRDHVKPAIASIGYDAVDLRDVSKAGIIDNLLRIQIRDAAFVLVDLTHENAGAYWEAGYAEGLGKPVLYICEKTKFYEKQTHFDTNHCTTVLWHSDHVEEFVEDLKATLKRSLNI
ncbi:hypothetical protein KFK14_00360 [Sphingobium phenoxybenzoativorans]|uniref:Nucleoside 2-deoxyribosyltransferase n=1 Tax=Sphingobium phenoxybenzoativorans TaxID=1592790 RepID=A0A975K728_9SPHN|nr:hypothetical protein [Sphingobium phenoxybenzoativorans]QUT06001.1 hypothetical protein KFK14_00360 [Sphingobium phenoxybenzoativorans]